MTNPPICPRPARVLVPESAKAGVIASVTPIPSEDSGRPDPVRCLDSRRARRIAAAVRGLRMRRS